MDVGSGTKALASAWSRVGFACVVACVAVSAHASADSQPGERVVVGWVQAFYDQTRTIEARFYQTYFHRLYERYDRSSGRVVFQKPGKMRWDYATPDKKVIASDGRRLVVYEPPRGDQPGQALEQALSQNELPTAFSFLTGKGDLGRDFDAKLLDPGRQGFKAGYVVELRPREPTPQFSRIVLYVDADLHRRGLVHRVLILDEAGNRNRFDFSEVRFNRPVAADRFRFEPPSGTRRVTGAVAP